LTCAEISMSGNSNGQNSAGQKLYRTLGLASLNHGGLPVRDAHPTNMR
jgi:hypothetical protein